MSNETHSGSPTSITRVAQRPLHTSIEGNRVKRGLAAGCLSFWLLLLGQARKSNSPVGAKPDAVIKQKNKYTIYRKENAILQRRPEEPTYIKQK